MRQARLFSFLLLLSTLAACERPLLPSPPTLEPLLVHAEWDWFRDEKRRVVLLRGANYSSLERAPDAAPSRAPREDDFRWLAGLGFNLIRLPIAWSSIEPEPNHFDTRFLRDEVDPLLRFASNQGMQVVLALDQARWSACIPGGHGAPAWSCPQPPDPGAAPGSPSRVERARCDFFSGAAAPDGRPLRDHYVDAWRVVARYYEQDRRVVGFDLLDEPAPGECFAGSAFVGEILDPLYGEIATAIRRTDAPQALFYQPAVAPDDPILGAPPGVGPDAAFAPHVFTQTYGAPAGGPPVGAALAALYARAERAARRLGGPLLLGEIGADAPPEGTYRPVTPVFLRESLDALDRHLVGGAVWAFVPQGQTPAHEGGLGIGNEEDARLLARPFARRIAGVPIAMRFDDASRQFELSFRDDPDVSPPDPSEIFLPAKRRYPEGFTVAVTPGDRWTFDAHAQRLLLYRGSTTGERMHVVRIGPPAR